MGSGGHNLDATIDRHTPCQLVAFLERGPNSQERQRAPAQDRSSAKLKNQLDSPCDNPLPARNPALSYGGKWRSFTLSKELLHSLICLASFSIRLTSVENNAHALFTSRVVSTPPIATYPSFLKATVQPSFFQSNIAGRNNGGDHEAISSIKCP